MKKFVLKATALAIGALVGGVAFADTNLDSGAVSGTTAFANELNYNSAASGTSIAVAPVVSSKLGFGVSGGQNRYIRVDLTNAKIAGADLTGASLAMAAAPAFANVTVVQGGAAGDDFVVFQVTANAAGHAASQTVNLTLGDLDVTSTGANATVAYKLYETAVDAANKTANTLYSKSGTLFSFAPALKFSLTTGTNTAAVEQSFKKFDGSSISTVLAKIGTVTYDVAALAKANGSAVALTDLVTGATKVVATGDFTAAGADGVFLSNSAACATTDVAGTLNGAKTSADLVVGTTAGTQGAANAHYYSLCYNVSGTVAVPVQTVKAALDLTAAAGATVSDVAAANAGDILHDGTELIAPFATIHGDYVSRVFLTSRHSANAKVEAEAFYDNGSSCTGTPVALADLVAGKQMEYKIADVCPTLGGTGNTTRMAVKFTIAAPKSKIEGVYNQYKKGDPTFANGKTTDQNTYSLHRPVAN